MAAAMRSITEPVCIGKSRSDTPVAFLGDHAKPQWSRAWPDAALNWRIALIWAET